MPFPMFYHVGQLPASVLPRLLTYGIAQNSMRVTRPVHTGQLLLDVYKRQALFNLLVLTNAVRSILKFTLESFWKENSVAYTF